jgi:hypothetical protein
MREDGLVTVPHACLLDIYAHEGLYFYTLDQPRPAVGFFSRDARFPLTAARAVCYP